MTDDSKDAERLAREIERYFDDTRFYSGVVNDDQKIRSWLQETCRLLKQQGDTIDRLTQERDEAHRSAEALQAEVTRLRELFEATRRWDATQPSTDDVERAREPTWAMDMAEEIEREYYQQKATPGYEAWITAFIANALEKVDAAARREAFNEGFKDANRRTTPGWRDLNIALRMIRDAVEELGPAGAVPSRDVGPPDYAQDAEDIIVGITRLVDAARREGAELRALDEAQIRSVVMGVPTWEARADRTNVEAAADIAKAIALAARDAAIRARTGE